MAHRQRKSTVHPQRKMQKKHKNTAELLDYLNTKSYDIVNWKLSLLMDGKSSKDPLFNSAFIQTQLLKGMISLISF